MILRHRILCSCLALVGLSALPLRAQPAPATAPLVAGEAKAIQQAWAGFLKRPIRITNSLGITFSLIPPGQFSMGSPLDEEWHREEEILHRVTLTRPFYLSVTEMTQGQWKALMGNNPSFFTGDNLPVETVTWDEANAFCRKLGQKDGAKYRLPTEAEWEYACRAGTTTPFHTGPTIQPGEANYDGNSTYAGGSKGEFRETTTPADTFAPNAWGLHDMHGNVWEWCQDWYAPYPKGETKDPTGPASGEKRVMRGGCWINFPAVCRSANRGGIKPVSWNFHVGFRIVQNLE